ncbi:MAG TPA: HNH endonuclease [Anaerolineae bacterium]|nr:HNH endonuclease [Anaerolineae bacterium]
MWIAGSCVALTRRLCSSGAVIPQRPQRPNCRMSRRRKIAPALREQIATRAQHRCSYCRSPQLIGVPMVFDHVVPLAAGGESVIENLCLSCYRCNEFKGAKSRVPDPETGTLVLLFHPCTQSWRDHFDWSEDSLKIVAMTACGRATIDALRLNDDRLVRARQIWKLVGLHPPLEE